eukprot:364556-Chlamydomonas_euryale.AAC.13
MSARRSGYGQPNIHTRLADEDKSLFVTRGRVNVPPEALAQPEPSPISWLTGMDPPRASAWWPHPYGRKGGLASLQDRI